MGWTSHIEHQVGARFCSVSMLTEWHLQEALNNYVNKETHSVDAGQLSPQPHWCLVNGPKAKVAMLADGSPAHTSRPGVFLSNLALATTECPM